MKKSVQSGRRQLNSEQLSALILSYKIYKREDGGRGGGGGGGGDGYSGGGGGDESCGGGGGGGALTIDDYTLLY